VYGGRGLRHQLSNFNDLAKNFRLGLPAAHTKTKKENLLKQIKI
jgi:hypothetical protein